MTQATPLIGISSKATQTVLAQLAAAYEAQTGQRVQIESVGGVDAAKRLVAGEPFDVVLLASDAIDKLIASGHLVAPRVDWVRSSVAVAVPAGAGEVDISSEAALKAAVLAAPSISYSTGPSGTYLTQLFARWGIADLVAQKLIVPPPGTPVGSLVASGQAALGFQQLSEFQGVAGIRVLGNLPEEVAFVTTFSAAARLENAAVGGFLAFLNAPQMREVKEKYCLISIN
jgi:molybdate transport system substrate-binding protein